MTGYTRLAAVLGLAVAMAPLPGAGTALAQGGRGGGGYGDGPLVAITGPDRTVIANYFIANPVGAEALPLWIAGNVVSGKRLPVNTPRTQPPAALMEQVGACRRPGLECLVVGIDMVVIETVDGKVLDRLRSVVR